MAPITQGRRKQSAQIEKLLGGIGSAHLGPGGWTMGSSWGTPSDGAPGLCSCGWGLTIQAGRHRPQRVGTFFHMDQQLFSWLNVLNDFIINLGWRNQRERERRQGVKGKCSCFHPSCWNITESECFEREAKACALFFISCPFRRLAECPLPAGE